MGFVGNKRGSRKSDIVAKLGADYFGISMEALDAELEEYLAEEGKGEVDAVYVDKDGRHYLLFYAPNGKTQRFYLDEHGCRLSGKINTVREKDR